MVSELGGSAPDPPPPPPPPEPPPEHAVDRAQSPESPESAGRTDADPSQADGYDPVGDLAPETAAEGEAGGDAAGDPQPELSDDAGDPQGDPSDDAGQPLAELSDDAEPVSRDADRADTPDADATDPYGAEADATDQPGGGTADTPDTDADVVDDGDAANARDHGSPPDDSEAGDLDAYGSADASDNADTGEDETGESTPSDNADAYDPVADIEPADPEPMAEAEPDSPEPVDEDEPAGGRADAGIGDPQAVDDPDDAADAADEAAVDGSDGDTRELADEADPALDDSATGDSVGDLPDPGLDPGADSMLDMDGYGDGYGPGEDDTELSAAADPAEGDSADHDRMQVPGSRPDVLWTGANYVEHVDPRDAQVYADIRENVGDTTRISENMGIPQDKLEQIKDHVFYQEHDLPVGPEQTQRANFSPDPDIATLWPKADAGTLDEAEKVRFERLMAHEYVESCLMEAGMPYRSTDPEAWDPVLGNRPTSEHYGAHDLAPLTDAARPPFAHWERTLGREDPGITEISKDFSDLDEIITRIRNEWSR
ncbi:hypothetical protein [Plantactinospora sp. KBS50]|uniref:hypothetical protein n=1 Tax=Plantactinospora sp. KBS50 TaxID=2024580 RepID=UPI0012FD90B9|nr:hypothetical protein [Plantactinospora sp. KBS50]